MARYLVLAKSFINNTLVEEGAVVEYTGDAGPNLELIKDEAPVSKKPKLGGKGNDDAATDLA